MFNPVKDAFKKALENEDINLKNLVSSSIKRDDKRIEYIKAKREADKNKT